MAPLAPFARNQILRRLRLRFSLPREIPTTRPIRDCVVLALLPTRPIRDCPAFAKTQKTGFARVSPFTSLRLIRDTMRRKSVNRRGLVESGALRG